MRMSLGHWGRALDQFLTLSAIAMRGGLTVPLQSSLDLASFTIEIRATRTSSGVLTGLANARRTGRGPCGVIADMSKPYRSTPVMLAEVTSVAFEKALQ
jgi:hypothetical protein